MCGDARIAIRNAECFHNRKPVIATIEAQTVECRVKWFRQANRRPETAPVMSKSCMFLERRAGQ